MTILVPEKLDPTTYRKLFTVLGTDYFATPRAWVSIVSLVGVGIVVGIVASPMDGPGANVGVGVVYGLMIVLVEFLHGIGHIISSRAIGAPMSRMIVTMTVITGQFDTNDVTSRQHLWRALGGPLMNLILGVIFVVIAPNHYVMFFGCFNIVFFLIAILPIPTLDGSVILRELRRGS